MQVAVLITADSEANLVALARRGRLDAYNQLVISYQDMVYTVAYYVLGDPTLAVQVTQETFADGFCQLASHRGDFREWIVRLVVAQCRKCQR